MKIFRLIIALIGTLLLVGGYFASQSAFFGATTAQYVQKLDDSPVPLLALGLLVSAVVLGFIPDKDLEAEE
jgi:hypothetical protein